MGFVARIFSPPSPPPQPAPQPEPVYTPPAPQVTVAPASDAAGAKTQQQKKRRAPGTVLTGDQTMLGATAGKSLLGQ